VNPQAVLFGILAGIPDLPGAACRGTAPMMDENHDEAAALALCSGCGALQACAAWFHSLAPRQRPEGVVAGLVHHRNVNTNRSMIRSTPTRTEVTR
jgi:hypothetical protein